MGPEQALGDSQRAVVKLVCGRRIDRTMQRLVDGIQDRDELIEQVGARSGRRAAG
jgi:hypothetical protein